MAEGKTNEELMAEARSDILEAKKKAKLWQTQEEYIDLGIADLNKKDILRGIVLMEILGPPKGIER